MKIEKYLLCGECRLHGAKCIRHKLGELFLSPYKSEYGETSKVWQAVTVSGAKSTTKS